MVCIIWVSQAICHLWGSLRSVQMLTPPLQLLVLLSLNLLLWTAGHCPGHINVPYLGRDQYRSPNNNERDHHYGATKLLIPISSIFWGSFFSQLFFQGLARLPSHLSTAHSHFTLDREEQEWNETLSRVQFQKKKLSSQYCLARHQKIVRIPL